MIRRISGVNIPQNKHIVIGLTEIFGLGRKTTSKICSLVGVNPSCKAKDLTEEEFELLRKEIGSGRYIIEGEQRRKTSMYIKRHKDIRTYRGLRHTKGLPVRGQRTRTNAKTRKGRNRTKSSGSLKGK